MVIRLINLLSFAMLGITLYYIVFNSESKRNQSEDPFCIYNFICCFFFRCRSESPDETNIIILIVLFVIIVALVIIVVAQNVLYNFKMKKYSRYYNLVQNFTEE